MNIRYDGRQPTFEEVYPRAPYAELIRHALALASWFRGFIGTPRCRLRRPANRPA